MWVAKLVARLLAPAALWVRVQTSLKNYKMQRSGQHNAARQINLEQNICYVTQVLQLCVKLLQKNTWLEKHNDLVY